MVNHRTWYYLGAAIIIGALIVFGMIESNNIRRQQILIQSQSTSDLQQEMTNYVAAQTDPHKLISLAKRLKDADSSILQIIIDKAYALNPNDRDTLVLASQFHPELASKITQIDPLYSASSK